MSKLLRKLAMVRQAGNETGGNVDALEKEVLRQIKQSSRSPIRGDGVTKSGGDD